MKLKKRYSFPLLYVCLFFQCIIAVAQRPNLINLHPPLYGNLSLSGTFGELRANHFHSGVDFRTGGQVGLKVFASERGYVSRVRVSGTGFGRAIYINHPNGYSTVYAHLDRFIPAIDSAVKAHQYLNESFEVDIDLTKHNIAISRGQLIGWSGNTGSSGGPHLHFEVRRTASQNPINPAFSNLPIIDSLPPFIRSAFLYNLSKGRVGYHINTRTELNVRPNGKHLKLKDTLLAMGPIAFGIEAFDYINRGSLRCGVYSITKRVNGEVWYEFIPHEFSFAETRYVNSHVDFELRQLYKQRVHRLLVEPNNLFSGYGIVRNRGAITVEAGKTYNVTITIADSYSNAIELGLVVKGYGPELASTPCMRDTSAARWYFDEENELITPHFRISLPSNSLYNDLDFTHGLSDTPKGYYSPVVHIHNRLTALHRPFWLSIRADSLPVRLKQKALLATFTPKGQVIAAGGSYSNGAVKASLREFGDFFIAVDTVLPTIVPINISNGKNMAKETRVRFRVKDDFSEVASFRGTINGNWVLFEYDPKTDLLFYEFDSTRLTRGRSHSLRLVVSDRVGNSAEYTCLFNW